MGTSTSVSGQGTDVTTSLHKRGLPEKYVKLVMAGATFRKDIQTLSGPYPSKVDSIAFVIRHPDDLDADDVPSCSDLRLFSSGGGSEVLEWDTHLGHVRVSKILFDPNCACLTNDRGQ